MLKLLRLLLFPFAVLYFIITEFRNFLFQSRIMRGAKFDRPIICIGNLSTGGTGKTPMIEYLVKYFRKEEKNPAVLSRGYGRKTTGFKLVTTESKSSECGDEPLQIKQKFPEVEVAVCEKRVDGIIHLIKENPKIDLILLDDAYQHRAVKSSFTIITSSFYQPFFTDFILPVGDLREMRRNVNRADAIVFTKCPDWVTEVEKAYFRRGVVRYSKAPVFFSTIKYGGILPVFGQGRPIELTHNILLVTGIANADPLAEKLSEKSTVKHLKFGDHHAYGEKDIERIAGLFNSFAQTDKIILTTEKDAKRFQTMNEKVVEPLKSLPVFYVEMEMEILSGSDTHNKEEFEQLISKHVSSFN